MSGDPGPWDDPDGGGGRRSGGWLWLALLAGGVALIGFLAWRFPGALAGEDGRMRMVYLVGLLALVASGVVAGRRRRLGDTAKQVAAWVGVALVLVVGYSYRFELTALGARVVGEILPHRGVETGEAQVTFRAGVDGHYRVEALVDGVSLRFLVDTGASEVMLSRADARRLGFDVDGLAYTRLFSTANGTVRGAPVRLREIVLGPIRLTDVVASVNRAPMAGSLLGMTFLGRLAGYEVRDGTLTLSQ